jgi:hypothetical protein
MQALWIDADPKLEETIIHLVRNVFDKDEDFKKKYSALSIYQFPRPPTEEVRAGRLGGF